MLIRALLPEDARAFWALRLRCFAEEPTCFGSSYEENRKVPLVEAEALLARRGRSPDDFVLGAFLEDEGPAPVPAEPTQEKLKIGAVDGGDIFINLKSPLVRQHLQSSPGPPLRLVGIAGFSREPRKKRAHRATLWGMYVIPEARGQGVARELLEELIRRARGIAGVERLNLTVMEHNERAVSLYRGLGWEQWGREPRAMCWEGQYFAEPSMG